MTAPLPLLQLLMAMNIAAHAPTAAQAAVAASAAEAAGEADAAEAADRAAMASGECPHRFYRTAAILFGCDSAAGTSHFLLAPAATTPVVNIPSGVKSFRIWATSDMDLGLKLQDPANGKYIVNSNSKQSAVISKRVRTGTYQGVNIAFSGSDSATPVQEHLYIFGSLPIPTVLKFSNRDSVWATVAMKYSHRGLTNCSVVPEGCSLYDEKAARHEVDAWGRWARSDYSTADEAWLMRGAPNAEKSTGILWHRWPAVWAQSLEPTILEGKAWQLAFHYVDADRNGEVSQKEFEVAYFGSLPSELPQAIAAPLGKVNTSGAVMEKKPDVGNATKTASSSDKMQRRSSSIVDISYPFLGIVALIMLIVFSFLWFPCQRRKKTRSARMVASRSRDFSDLEVLEDSVLEEKGAVPTDNDAESVLTDQTENGLAQGPDVAQEGSDLSSYAMPSAFSGMTMLGQAASSWGLQLPSSFGGFWPQQDSFRYEPVPVADERGLQGSGSFWTPGTPMVQGTCTSAGFGKDFYPQHGYGQGVGSRPVSLDGSFRFVSAIGSVSVPPGAPKLHIVERSYPFSSSAAQAPPTVTVVERVNTFSKLPGSASGEQASASTMQTPWAAVFTPEEWARLIGQQEVPLFH